MLTIYFICMNCKLIKVYEIYLKPDVTQNIFLILWYRNLQRYHYYTLMATTRTYNMLIHCQDIFILLYQNHLRLKMMINRSFSYPITEEGRVERTETRQTRKLNNPKMTKTNHVVCFFSIQDIFQLKSQQIVRKYKSFRYQKTVEEILQCAW